MTDGVYGGVREPLVLLMIDETRLHVPWRVDDMPGVGAFPHVYGPVEVAAVVMATPLTRDAGGRLELPALT